MMSRIGAYRPDIIFLVSAVNLKIACQATIIFEVSLFRRIGPCLRVPMLCYLLCYSSLLVTRYSFPRFAWERIPDASRPSLSNQHPKEKEKWVGAVTKLLK